MQQNQPKHWLIKRNQSMKIWNSIIQSDWNGYENVHRVEATREWFVCLFVYLVLWPQRRNVCGYGANHTHFGTHRQHKLQIRNSQWWITSSTCAHSTMILYSSLQRCMVITHTHIHNMWTIHKVCSLKMKSMLNWHICVCAKIITFQIPMLKQIEIRKLCCRMLFIFIVFFSLLNKIKQNRQK